MNSFSRAVAASLSVAAVFACAGVCTAERLPWVRTIDAKGLVRLDSLRTVARKAKGADVEPSWYRCARFALDHAGAATPPGEDDPKVAEVLKEACSRLPASSLASLAAWGPHAIVGEAFARAVAEPKVSQGPLAASTTGVSEAVAEARDAVDRYDGKAAKPFAKWLERGDSPAFGAGGAEQSVFRVVVVSADFQDTSGTGAYVVAGVRDGLAYEVGPWSDRFHVTVANALGHYEPDVAYGASGIVRGQGAGVVLVADGLGAWPAAMSGAVALRVLAVDARSRDVTDPREAGEWTSPISPGWSGDLLDSNVTRNFARFRPDGRHLRDTIPDLGRFTFRPTGVIVLRPPDVERARRLAQVARARPGIRKIAVAVPESLEGYGFAACFAEAARAMGMEIVSIPYAAGRRDFAAEVKRFRDSSADALFFPGPADETVEWLNALDARKVRTLVLGDRALDPEGFHERARGAVEGAIFVGDDWREVAAVHDEAPVRAAAKSGREATADYRRAFRFGRSLGRAAASGAYTVSRLEEALQDQSLPTLQWRPLWWVGVRVPPGGVSGEARVPLYVVKGGKAQPYGP